MEEMIKISISHESDKDPRDFRTPMSINETMKSRYGDSWVLFLPETIRQSIKKDMNFTAGYGMMNKIMAVQTVLLDPYLSWDIFENICLSFNDITPSFLIIEGMTTLELVWGFICIKALRPDYQPDEEVESYIKVIMQHCGLVWCPWLGYAVGDVDLVKSVKEVWKSEDKFTEDNSVGIQIDRLDIIKRYVKSWEA